MAPLRIREKDGGYTTFFMAVSLLLTLSLVFTSAQVYRVTSASARIQDVADAASLAAENQVAEFMIAAKLCDAVVLSLTLAALTVTGLGVAALCTPVTASLSDALIQAGKQLMDARNTFSDNAADGLNAYQKTLPFLSAAQANKVARANQGGVAQSDYTTVALLLPGSGESICVEREEKAEQAQNQVDEESEEIKEHAKEAEDAAKRANAAKLEAYRHDCGLNPDYCLYQRAETLAGMSGSSNPYYSSVDTWSFSAALNRAKGYYQQRLANESPDSGSTGDQARSALREIFYSYAVTEMSMGYVIESDEVFECYFPRLPRNTAEMRETSLYYQNDYPISINSKGKRVMHAWMGCPSCDGIAYWGSISQQEDEGYPVCPDCGFDATSMGQVAQASSSISNGFEYHYNIVADAAEQYQQAKRDMNPHADKVKEGSQSLFDQLLEALKEAADKRLNVNPPGSSGCIVLIIDRSQMAASAGFESSFVRGQATLGTRAAVSGATLLADKSDEAATVITSLLDNIKSEGGVALGALGLALDCWSNLLGVYTEGQQALTRAIEHAVDAIPFASESGLGVWAAKQLTEMLRGVGLQPADLSALRPVLVNTGYIAGECDSPLSVGFLAAKEAAIATGEEGGLFGSILGAIRYAAVGKLNDRFEIATIRPFGDKGPSIPITIRLPESVQSAAEGILDQAIARLREVTVGSAQTGVWR